MIDRDPGNQSSPGFEGDETPSPKWGAMIREVLEAAGGDVEFAVELAIERLLDDPGLNWERDNYLGPSIPTFFMEEVIRLGGYPADDSLDVWHLPAKN